MLRKSFLLFILIIAGVLAYGYYHFDSIVRSAIETHLSKSLGVEVRVKHSYFKVFDGNFSLKGVKISNPKGYSAEHIFTVDKIDVSVDMKTIFENLLIVRNIKINSPKLFYEVNNQGDNINMLRKKVKDSAKNESSATNNASNKTKEEQKIIIHKFFINNGKIYAKVSNVGDKEIKLPDIYIQNIGRDQNGVTVSNATEQVVRELTKVISKINLQSLFKEIIKVPNEVKNLLQDTVEENAKSLLNNLISK